MMATQPFSSQNKCPQEKLEREPPVKFVNGNPVDLPCRDFFKKFILLIVNQWTRRIFTRNALFLDGQAICKLIAHK
jgi:hypothetical protein